MKQNRIAVDIGGTFTDVVLECADKQCNSVKVPTTPEDPVSGSMTGIHAVLNKAGTGLNSVDTLIHGTTLVTNTMIEKKGARTGVIFTAGFRDILEIGYERRYNQEDLLIDKPDLLVTREYCQTVEERLAPDGSVFTALDESTLYRCRGAGVVLHRYARRGSDRQAGVRARHGSHYQQPRPDAVGG